MPSALSAGFSKRAVPAEVDNPNTTNNLSFPDPSVGCWALNLMTRFRSRPVLEKTAFSLWDDFIGRWMHLSFEPGMRTRILLGISAHVASI